MDVENPEKFLPLTPFNAEDPNGDVNPTILENSDKETEAIHALAIALVQVGESIKPKFLKAPLGKLLYFFCFCLKIKMHCTFV